MAKVIDRLAKQTVIQKMVEVRTSHINWAAKQSVRKANGKLEIENVGTAEHHKKWVEVYDSVLCYLRQE